mmetsp:Transcript_22410/g.32674  ORF Transcript_22410/g.32674 Transcript_22410/m.32674 type:complete len:541 (+) Transcript_22410:143-1765(+)|eukprot:CAMPEP_0185039074 /NCGR_PEP_ID=MMETSP1103-20130426/35533_1 /TAXON_ID=36769 /ORGANISM="Paraphysomonas bandaiensis, Strain Caron Lab Isolate" /LENGTH=540 /DNA_ID=CAMNT_0027577825 /DNA_START=99 /DNA_END=1721 /DNA_ORIENTATION=+
MFQKPQLLSPLITADVSSQEHTKSPATINTVDSSTSAASGVSNRANPVFVSVFSINLWTDSKKIRVVGEGILTFIALVIYQHAVYDVVDIDLSFTPYVIYGFCLFWACTALMILTRSLEFLVQYDDSIEPEEPDSKNLLPELDGYWCGAVDSELRTCFGIDCTFHACKMHFYILRFFRYNANAILISACWVGSDIFLYYLATRHNSLPARIVVNLCLLSISNAILMSLGQLSGQFGVFDDEDVIFCITTPNTSPRNSFSHPSPSSNQNLAAAATSMLNSTSASDTASTSPIPSPRMEKSESEVQNMKPYTFCKVPMEFKVVFTLIAVVLYWFATWDLFGEIPTEFILASLDRDDDSMDDDGRDHENIHTHVEWVFLLFGLGYCIVGFVVVIFTGELYSVINVESDDAQEAHEGVSTSLSKRFKEIGIDVDRLQVDVVWKFGDKIFLPLRLINYNLLGIAGVVAWIGLDYMMTSIENLFIYEYNDTIALQYTVDVLYVLIANVLLTYLQQFGNQFGGRDILAKKHEIVSLDGAFNSASDAL